eukprot:gnl/Ergobibamus_cyprinoides/1385.p1 GENE.gnl/Ergobibamus_cyprinoides/1385~~gnl/Ergobibamus_cyprinoides/1385.p1  ORF type:complete len:248 (+),score=43.56 gnl/Ergobibamus_cyprinoides/1385:135-878(+)
MPTWPELNARARHLEQDLSVKLSSLSARLSTLARSELLLRQLDSAASLPDPEVVAGQVQSHADLVDLAIAQIADVREAVEALATVVRLASAAAADEPPSTSKTGSISRHTDILASSRSELDALTKVGQESAARFQLLETGLRSSLLGSHAGSDSLRRGLLQESLGIAESNRQASALISQALLAQDSLEHQGAHVSSVSAQIYSSFITRLPSISATIQSIGRYRNRDTVVLAVVAALCVCFILWYKLK